MGGRAPRVQHGNGSETPGASSAPDPNGVLQLFHPLVQEWFRARYGEPSPPQVQGWPVIARGEHSLLLAPTGSGKTLAAFYVFLDRLFRQAWESHGATGAPNPASPGRGRRQAPGQRAPAPRGVRLLYISPLKALDNDVHRNLEEPLEGIAALAASRGMPGDPPTRAVRTGDTPASARQAMIRRPPDILITTPESLLLILLSPRAREILKPVEAVIVDEIHQLAGGKRGVQLALTLEWLEAWTGRPIQRVGLSATQRPLERIAAFLGGDRPVRIVDAGPPAGEGALRRMDLRVEGPVESFSRLRQASGKPSIWPALEARVLELIRSHRSTLVFVQNRGQAERVTRELNQLAGEPLVRSHHGSLSREVRERVEADLKAGRLRGLVATSTLELGIDVGAVDLVVQVESPKTAAAALQRVGRAGHLLSLTSQGRILPKTPLDLLEATAVARAALEGAIEETRVPENCLDVLAQQVAAMAAAPIGTHWEEEALFRLVRRAYPYRRLTRRAFQSVLRLLSGGYSHPGLGRLKPRIEWNRVLHRIEPLPGTRLTVATQGGTIPDRGLYRAVTHDRRLVGELDEEFVFESRVGEVFVLGNTAWQIDQIGADRVIVSPAPGRVPKLPFWHGEPTGRSLEMGERVGRLLRELSERLGPAGGDAPMEPAQAHEPGPSGEGSDVAPEGQPEGVDGIHGASTDGAAAWLQRHYPVDRRAARNLVELSRKQKAATGFLPDDRRLLLEFFPDEVGDWRAVLHAPFGERINRTWLLALQAAARRAFDLKLEGVVADEGLLLRFPGLSEPPVEVAHLDLLTDLEALVRDEAAGSPLFATLFRHAAARALLVPRSTGQRRMPLWQQRLRAGDLLDAFRNEPDFPLVVESLRELWTETLDVPALRRILTELDRGERSLEVARRPAPSPMASGLVFRFLGAFMYEYDSPRAERRSELLQLSQAALREALGSEALRELLDPGVIAEVEAELQGTAPGFRARSTSQLLDLMARLGSLTPQEAAARADGPAEVFLAELERAGLARPLPHELAPAAPARAGAWVPASLLERIGATVQPGGSASGRGGEAAPPVSPGDPAALLRRELLLRDALSRGPFTAEEAAARFGWGNTETGWLQAELEALDAEGRLVRGAFRPGITRDEWCEPGVLRRIHRQSLARARREVQPVSLEALQAFVLRWQGVEQDDKGRTGEAATGAHPGDESPPQALDRPGSADTLEEAIEEALAPLQGWMLPFSLWEAAVIPARLPRRDAAPQQIRSALDGLVRSGRWLWVGGQAAGELACAFFRRDLWPALAPAWAWELLPPDDVEGAVLDALRARGALFAHELLEALPGTSSARIEAALWNLARSGRVTHDGLDALRLWEREPPGQERGALERWGEAPFAPGAGGGGTGWRSARASLRVRARRHAREVVGRQTIRHRILFSGRWSTVPHAPGTLGTVAGEPTLEASAEAPASPAPPARSGAPSRRPEGGPPAHALDAARLLLERYGIVTRDLFELSPLGRWEEVLEALLFLEGSGEVRRGLFVDGLAGLQFALPEAVEALRAGSGEATAARPASEAYRLLAALDPANLGPILRGGRAEAEPAATEPPVRRLPGVWLLLRGARPVLAVEPGPQRIMPFGAWDELGEAEHLQAVHALLAGLPRAGAGRSRLVVSTWDSEPVLEHPAAALLQRAGFERLPNRLVYSVVR
ncbi:DEAD/DEAH box helicase [Limnochorda pilosa]|uniref:DEAD/DEAH box helicase n=1 Tax=Limnochorda pilosa TaxID=1555112 RepID=UPI00130DE2CA|nr:DEAD/DEAH box helicase [Limnochorda pilosa]